MVSSQVFCFASLLAPSPLLHLRGPRDLYGSGASTSTVHCVRARACVCVCVRARVRVCVCVYAFACVMYMWVCLYCKVLHGMSGVGKSSLVQIYTEQACQRGHYRRGVHRLNLSSPEMLLASVKAIIVRPRTPRISITLFIWLMIATCTSTCCGLTLNPVPNSLTVHLLHNWYFRYCLGRLSGKQGQHFTTLHHMDNTW